MMQPNAIACESEWVAQLLFVRKLQNTACDWSLQESCKLLIAYSQLLLIQRILWATETALIWQNLCVSINLSSYWTLSILAIDLPSEEASVSYPECILWASVHSESYCLFIETSHIVLADFDEGLSRS